MSVGTVAIRLSDEQYAWFKESIAAMKAIYAVPDDGHVEYWDADDIARDVAEALGDIIAEGAR